MFQQALHKEFTYTSHKTVLYPLITFPLGPQRLLGFVLAATSCFALSSGQLKAQSFSPVNPPVVLAGGATFTAISGPTAPGTPNSGSIQFEYQGLQPNVPNPDLNKTWTLTTTFDPSLAGPYSGVFEYRLDAPPFEQWLRASLSQNIIAPFAGASVTKEVCADSSFTNCTTIGPVTDAGFTGFNPNIPASTIFVRDTYVGVPPALLKNYINTFQTPGPLPILGAGAAFGFSRRLRRRIKLSQQAG